MAAARCARSSALALLLGAVASLPLLASRGIVPDDPTLLLSRAGLAARRCSGWCCSSRSIATPAQAARQALKYLVIGVGVLFAYDLFLYSQAELLRGIIARCLECARRCSTRSRCR